MTLIMHTTSAPTPIANAMRAQLAIDCVVQGKSLKVAPDIAHYEAKPGALLVEPLNASPFVIVGTYDDSDSADFAQYSTHTFHSDPGSGTDRIRARAHAQMFFDSLGGNSHA